MQRTLLFTVLLHSVFGYDNPSTKVQTLTDASFPDFVANSVDKPVIVEFFAPWCGHCKALAPTYDKLADQKSNFVRFGAIDATKYKALAANHGVKGYPTIVWFKNGANNFRQYRGALTMSGLTQLVDALVAEPVSSFETLEQVEEFQSTHAVTNVLYVSRDAEPSQAAKAVESFTFACGSLQDVVHCAAIGQLPREIMPDKLAIAAVRHEGFKAADGETRAQVDPVTLPLDGTVPLNPLALQDTITQWMEQFYLPLVTDVTGVNFGQVTRSGKISIFGACPDDAAAALFKAAAYPVVHPVTSPAEVRGHLSKFNFGAFVIVDDRAEKFMEKFGITKETSPALVALDYTRDRFYSGTGYPATAEGLARFVADIGDGKVAESALTLMANLDMKWEAAVSVIPFLRTLDFMPRFSLLMVLVLVVLSFVFWFVLRGGPDDEDDLTQAPPTKHKMTSSKEDKPKDE